MHATYAREQDELLLIVQPHDMYRVRLPQLVQTDAGKVKKREFSAERSRDGGNTWRRISLSLSIASWLRYASIFHRDRWPPDYVDSCFVDNNRLTLRFRDALIMNDLPYSPNSSDREAEWLATYFPKRRCWKLRRLRVLNYDGTDSPPPLPG